MTYSSIAGLEHDISLSILREYRARGETCLARGDPKMPSAAQSRNWTAFDRRSGRDHDGPITSE